MKFLVSAIILCMLPFSGAGQVPDFTVTDTDGNTHNLYAHLDSNRYVVLDFFFTNCSFCQYYAPQVQQAFEDFGCNNGNTYFLGIDYGDSTQAVIDFKTTYGLEYPLASGVEGGGDSVVALYNVTGYPLLMLISPQKQLLKVISSPSTSAVDTILSLAGCQMMPCDVGGIMNGISMEPVIYPNPAGKGDRLIIEFDTPGEQVLEARLFDLQGRILLKASDHELKRDLQLPDDIPSGLYYLSFRTENRQFSLPFTVTN